MASDEQRVRTMAGWIGVEISRSRVRTPGKPGYGLYRVRGSKARDPLDLGECRMVSKDEMPDIRKFVPTEWTAYAFGLGVIEAAVRNSIEQGRPAGPLALHLVEDASAVKTGEGGYAGGCAVPTRWTPAYRGRRDLGVAREWGAAELAYETIKTFREAERGAGEVTDWGEVARAKLARMVAERGAAECGCPLRIDGGEPALHLCVRCGFEGGDSVHSNCSGCRETVRTRQRAQNNEFQAEHLERRRHGLVKRHAAKLRQRNDEPAQLDAEGLEPS